jgi:hypothetical protein
MDFETNEIAESFWHVINLGFHEAGHLIFQLFGRFVMVLGGTLGQLIAPVVLLFLFIFRNRDYFSASLCLWWLGQSFMDCAPYINDALAQRLMLLSGGTGRDSPGSHDWNYMLNQFGMIQYHHEIALSFHIIGAIIMLIAFAWGAIALYFSMWQESTDI